MPPSDTVLPSRACQTLRMVHLLPSAEYPKAESCSVSPGASVTLSGETSIQNSLASSDAPAAAGNGSAIVAGPAAAPSRTFT